MPGALHFADAELLLSVLPQVMEAAKSIIADGLTLTDNQQEIFWHEKKGDQCSTTIRKPFELPNMQKTARVDTAVDTETGKPLFAEILSRDYDVSGCIEMDILYFPTPAGKTKDGDEICMRMLMVADSDSGLILDAKPLDADTDSDEAMLNRLIGLILGSERIPETLRVFDDKYAMLFGSVCDELGIELETGDLPAITEVSKGFLAQFGGG
jgi:hypothetical protein